MRLTKTTSHAIRILIDCAQARGELIKVAEIAGRLEITPLNVFKIVHMLSRAGFIVAVRGRNGGVRLARPAAEIRIGDVVRATEITSVEVESAAEDRKRSKKGARKLNTIFDEALERLHQRARSPYAGRHGAGPDRAGRIGCAGRRQQAAHSRRCAARRAEAAAAVVRLLPGKLAGRASSAVQGPEAAA